MTSASPAARPHVTRVVIGKSAHSLTLYDGSRAVAAFRVAIGPGGPGNKHREGDEITPVGHYHVVSHAPSAFHIFMRLDYPNAEDRARFTEWKANGALATGATIGGDIGIHGAPKQAVWKPIHKSFDWTLGCIALDDDEIEQVAAWVADGMPVDIED